MKQKGRLTYSAVKWGLVLTLVLPLAGCAGWQEYSKRVENPYPGEATAVARGKALYSSKGCPLCHGEKGAGDGPESARLRVTLPDFSDRDRMITRSDPDLFWAIVRGRERTGMPAYREQLSENEAWDIVNHLRSLYQ